MTATQTQTQSNTTYSLPLTGRAPTPDALDSWASSLVQRPLASSGAVAQFAQRRITPAIGLAFEQGLQLKDVLLMEKHKRDEIIRELAFQISYNGVCTFANQDLKPEQLAEIALLLGELSGKPADSTLHIHPTQELGENGLPVGQINSVATADGRQISFADERSTFSAAGFHTDISFEPRSAAYSLLRMHILPPCGGDTMFASAYKFYDILSPSMAAFLETLTATHTAEMFREQSRRNGFKLHMGPRGAPENVGDDFRAVHPVIRTNPVTGLKGLFVNKTFTTRINELTIDESNNLLNYLFNLQHQCYDAHTRINWNTNDLAIWDNRSTIHAATFDYEELRAGDRTVCCGEAAYLDPNSISRKDFEARAKAAAASA